MGKRIKEADIELAKRHAPVNFIGDDIIITDYVKAALTDDVALKAAHIFIVLCKKGELRCTADTESHIIHRNEMMVISDCNVVESYMASDDAEGVCMILSTDFIYEMIRDVSDISTLFRFTRKNTVISLTSEQTTVLEAYLPLLQNRLADTANHFRREIVRSLTLTLFYELSNVLKSVTDIGTKHMSRADEIFTRFIQLVEKRYKEHRQVGWYATELFVSPKYLSETVKRVSGQTPTDWIDRYVTLEIRVQLRNTTKSIKEISSDMNFSDQSFLGRYFKEHVGVSPSKYRKG